MENKDKPSNRKPGYYWVKHSARVEFEIAYWHPLMYWSMIDSRKHFNDIHMDEINETPISINEEGEQDYHTWQENELKKYAFPGRMMGLIGDTEQEIPIQGMTKREVIAMAAMQGILSGNGPLNDVIHHYDFDNHFTLHDAIAEQSRIIADALLKEFDK